MAGMIREERFEANDVSLTLAVIDAGGEPRELYLHIEDGGIRFTVFHRTEHTLVPVNRYQAQEIARWLVERVGLPPGIGFVEGRLEDRRQP